MSKELNSYNLSRAWFDFCFENAEKIKPNHTALYFFAIEQCNRLGWKKVFGLPTTMTMEAIGIRSYNTYKNTLDDLVTWKFITMVEVSKNQFSSNKIALSNFNKSLNNALDKALITHGSKQSESTSESISSVDKQGTTNQEPITNNKVYSNEVHACYDKCLISFEKHLHPKNEKEKLNWLDTIDKLNRIDGIELDLIARITKHIRKDAFWAKNFLSLNKLRKNNKDGIMFIVVFHEQLKSKSNGQQETTASSLSDAHRRFKEGTVN